MDYVFDSQLEFTLFEKQNGLTHTIAHFHPYSQLIIPKGKGIVVNLANCPPYELPAKSLLFLSPFVRHRVISTQPCVYYDSLCINLNRLGAEFASTPYLSPIYKMIKHGNLGLLYSGEAVARVKRLFAGIRNLFRMEYMLATLEILHILARTEKYIYLAQKESHPEHPREIQFCMTTSQYVRDNLNQKIDIGTASNLMHMSKSSFARQFKRFFGTTFYNYVIHKKIEIACYLLFTTSMTIQEITDYLNFNSASHFIMTFRRLRNITPACYRSQQHYLPE